MIGLFFEVIPLEGHPSRYLKLAAALRPELGTEQRRSLH
jgi:hypothetical protein